MGDPVKRINRKIIRFVDYRQTHLSLVKENHPPFRLCDIFVKKSLKFHPYNRYTVSTIDRNSSESIFTILFGEIFVRDENESVALNR